MSFAYLKKMILDEFVFIEYYTCENFMQNFDLFIQGEEDLDQWFIVMKKVISKEHNQSGDDNLHLCLCVKHELT